MDSLQLTLLVALVVMVLINIATLLWATHLGHKLNTRPGTKVYEVHVEGAQVFKDIDMAEVEKQAKAQLQQAATEAATQLHNTIRHTVEQVGMHVDEAVQNTINQEFEKYQISLQALREQSIAEFSKLQAELNDRRSRMIEALEKQANAELGRRIDQFNMRLGDVVSGYVVESLGEQVDLGAQLPYILQNLEKHKDDIKRDILNS